MQVQRVLVVLNIRNIFLHLSLPYILANGHETSLAEISWQLLGEEEFDFFINVGFLEVRKYVSPHEIQPRMIRFGHENKAQP